MKKFLKTISVFLIFCFIFALTGCKSNDFSLNVHINSLPKLIDPQLATTETELMLCKNLFSGLLKLSDDGTVTTDAAESYYLTNDGKKYTFNIKDKLSWSDGTPLTAYDFEFAFKRLADIQNRAKNSYLLKGIKNADDILSGNASVDLLGVKAQDNRTLIIELNEKNDLFLNTLCNVAFMPCNKAFFEECKGAYGLKKSALVTNGKYLLQSWSEKSIKLKKDFSSKEAAASIINLIPDNTTDNYDLLKNNTYDIININDENVTKAKDLNYTCVEAHNGVLALVFNSKSELGSNKELIKSLGSSFNLQNRYISIFSENVTYNGCLISIKPQKYDFPYSIEESRNTFLNLPDNIKKGIAGANICSINSSSNLSNLKSIVSEWQKNLGAYINIKEYSNDSFYKSSSNGELGYLIKTTDSNSDISVFLEMFVSNSSSNYFGYSNSEYDYIINKLKNTNNVTDISNLLLNAEKILFDSGYVLPITKTSSYTALNNRYVYSGVLINQALDFTKIKIK